MTIVRELIAFFGFQVDAAGAKAAEESYKKIKKGATDSTKAFADAAKGAKDAIKDLAVSVGAVVGAIGTAALATAKATADAASAAVDAADRLGITVEAMQELDYAAKSSSASTEELVGGLRNLGKVVEDARRGEKGASETISRLGVKILDASGNVRPLDQILTDVSAKFASMPADARSSTLAMDAFGKSGLALLPLLREGPAGLSALRQEARDLGVVMDEGAARGAKAVGDELGKSAAVVVGLRNTIGLGLLPIVRKMSEAFRQWVAVNKKDLSKNIANAVAALARWAVVAGRALTALFRIGSQAITMLGGIEGVSKLAGIAMGVFFAGKVYEAAKAITVLGNASLVAAKKWTAASAMAVAKPLLVGTAIIALFALILGLWDEVAVELDGGSTLIGRIKRSFLMNDIDWKKDHPMVIVLKAITHAARDAYDAIQALAKLGSDIKDVVFPAALGSRQAALNALTPDKNIVPRMRAAAGALRAPATERGAGLLDRLKAAGSRGFGDDLPSFESLVFRPTPPGARPVVLPSITVHVGGVDARGASDPSAVGAAVDSRMERAARMVFDEMVRATELSNRSPVKE